MSRTPISDYALLSDCHGAALVSREGQVDWLCWPRFDSPPLLGRLLGERAGHWTLGVHDGHVLSRRYQPGSLVLESHWKGPWGEALVEEALDLGPSPNPHRLGQGAPRRFVRRVTVLAGMVDVDMRLSVRQDFGSARPDYRQVAGGWCAHNGSERLRLSAPPGAFTLHEDLVGRWRLHRGEQARFVLAHASPSDPETERLRTDDVEDALARTKAAWVNWSEEHQAYEGFHGTAVHHGGRVLQALTYEPTGAVVAAPTTSLPESPDGGRNWDYRYCWVRDAALTLDALWVAACPDEAARFFEFLAHAARPRLEAEGRLPIMFDVLGSTDLPEREIAQLEGWMGIGPVLIGNAASSQVQLDVYGEVLGAAWRLREQLGALDGGSIQRLLVRVADAAAAHWREPDYGIWEVRRAPSHHVQSKLGCWVALDRAVRMADRLSAGARVRVWERERDAVRDAILREGWSEKKRAFTQAFGSQALDAAVLRMPIMGFLPGDDPRVQSTVDRIRDELSAGDGLLFRYLSDDGLPGDEGAFVACSFWLSEALALGGRLDEAREVFEHVAARANDLGLFSEELSPSGGEMWGNFPQAFSHVGLVNAAWAIESAPAPSRRQGAGMAVNPAQQV